MFFSVFSLFQKASGNEDSLGEDSRDLSLRLELGQFFHKQIVQRAVQDFTGEATENDDNVEEVEEGEGEELEVDEEGDDEDDATVNPKKEPSQPFECKHQ